MSDGSTRSVGGDGTVADVDHSHDPASTAVLEADEQIGPDAEMIVTAALSMIDEALATLLQRELISANEVTDVLLDLRTTLSAAV
jgi:hypothetical protein